MGSYGSKVGFIEGCEEITVFELKMAIYLACFRGFRVGGTEFVTVGRE